MQGGAFGLSIWRITIHSGRRRFAARLKSGVRPRGGFVSIWYIAAIFASLGLSWWVSDLYSRNCRCTETRLIRHGALEFNVNFLRYSFYCSGTLRATDLIVGYLVQSVPVLLCSLSGDFGCTGKHRVRPENSFKPTPCRGSSRVLALR